MSRISFLAAAGIILAANAFALIHAARNRSGNPDAKLDLSIRELRYTPGSIADDDSGVALDLLWTDGFMGIWNNLNPPEETWLDKAKLQSLGFDCSVDPASPQADRFYERQRPRRVFVAFEYDGPAWQAWSEEYERSLQRQPQYQPNSSNNFRTTSSRLVPIDADADPAKLRGRHPNRSQVAIMPAAVAIQIMRYYPSPARLQGRFQQVPSSIQVALPLSSEVRSHRGFERARVVWGSMYEPWVESVEFSK